MTRAAYRLYRLTSAIRYRARRHLTPGGWMVALGLFLTGGMSTDIDQSAGYQAFGLLAALAIAAILCMPFFRTRFSVERTLPRFGTVGEPLSYHVTVHNHGGHTERGLSIYEDLADPRPTYEDFLRETRSTKRRRSFQIAPPGVPRRVALPRPQPLPPVISGGEAETELQLNPQRRGVLHLRGISVARPDPFHLVRSFSAVSAPASLTILPRRYPLPNITLPGAARHQQGGTANASSIGESEEFVALRDYRQGDPMRRIHWRSWAKAGRPVTKEYQDEFFVRHALILDTYTEPDNDQLFEEAISVAASFACTINTQESLLDLLFVGPEAYSFTVGRGLAHAGQMLEILASVETCVDQPFEALEQVVVEHSAAVSGCICIFLEWDERRQRLVRKLESLGVPVLVLVVREANAPALTAGKVAVQSPVHELHVGTIAQDLATL